MKKTGMAKSDAMKLMGKMGAPGGPVFGKSQAPLLDRRELRKRDQALGLVPFSVKLNSELVQQLQSMAKERGVELNKLVGEVITKGLDGS